MLKIWVLLLIFQGHDKMTLTMTAYGFSYIFFFFRIRTSINILLNLCLRVTVQQTV